MSVYGIRPNPLATPSTRTQPAAPRTDRQPLGVPAQTPGTTPAQRTTQTPATKAAPQTLPSQAPPGTDPELWSVLSADERAFFAKVGAMGPLTYGRMMSGGTYQPATTASFARGGRLDVKV